MQQSTRITALKKSVSSSAHFQSKLIRLGMWDLEHNITVRNWQASRLALKVFHKTWNSHYNCLYQIIIRIACMNERIFSLNKQFQMAITLTGKSQPRKTIPQKLYHQALLHAFIPLAVMQSEHLDIVAPQKCSECTMVGFPGIFLARTLFITKVVMGISVQCLPTIQERGTVKSQCTGTRKKPPRPWSVYARMQFLKGSQTSVKSLHP